MCFHQIIWYKLTLTFFEDNLAINMWKLYGCVLIVSYIHCFIDYWLGNLSTNFHTLESLTSIALDNMDGLSSLYSYYCQKRKWHINGLAQDYSNSSALVMEFLQSCAKPSIYIVWYSSLMFYFLLARRSCCTNSPVISVGKNKALFETWK